MGGFQALKSSIIGRTFPIKNQLRARNYPLVLYGTRVVGYDAREGTVIGALMP